MTFHMRPLSILALMAGALPAIAQTTPATPPTAPAAPATCTTAPTSVTALNLERTVALTGVSSTAMPTIPAALQGALASGALELRQQFSYNPGTNIVTITEFAAQPSSSSPTSPGNIVSSNVLSSENFSVDKWYFSCQPTPSLLVTGTITQNYPVSPVGNLTGVPAAISIGYTTDNPAKVNNAVIVYAGIASVYSAAATGTLTFPAGSVTPPGSNTNAPVIVVAGGLRQATTSKQYGLDVSGSTSPAKLAITFSAIQVAPPTTGSTPGSTTGIPQAASISPTGATGIFLITFGGGKGTYAFQVTAMDTNGASSTQVVVIDYNGN